MRRLLLAGVAFGALGALGAYTGLWLENLPGPSPTALQVQIPRGSQAEVATVLKTHGIIGSEAAFRAFAAMTFWHGKLRAAEFEFPARASLRDVLEVLRFGRPVQHKVTFAEGLTSAQIGRILAGSDALTGDVPIPAEGSLLPQTYVFERGTSISEMLDRARAALSIALRQAWARRSSDLQLTNPWEALILASLVERETARGEERAMVARVFMNRLRVGMRLQSDPTSVYGSSGGIGVLDRELTRADLERDDPDNTYVVAGLPATPICHPGLAAIEAVMHPARSDAIYFVADGTGGHAFAATLAEHERNVARLRSLRQ